MTKTKHVLMLFATAALPATMLSGMAVAQAQNAPTTPPDQGGAMTPEHGGAMTPEHGGTMPAEHPGTMMHSTRPIPINGHFSFALPDSCTYLADVRGTARPVHGAMTATGEERYSPNVTVDASVTCPNAQTMRVSEHLMTSHPMTMSELQSALELRASLITQTAGQRCAYVPDFRVSPERLEGVGAALLCPLPAQGAVRGGGPMQQQ